MVNSRKINKITSKASTKKSSQTVSKEKLTTHPKNYAHKSCIVSPILSPIYNMNTDILSDKIDTDILETSKVNNTTSTLVTSSDSVKKTASGKRSNSQVDPCTTHLDAKSLEGFKKHKCLKAHIKPPRNRICACLSKKRKTKVTKKFIKKN